MIKPTDEQYEQWRASPVTEWLMAFLAAEQRRTIRACHDASWQGPLTPAAHAALRERWETLQWVRTLDMESIEAALASQGDRRSDGL